MDFDGYIGFWSCLSLAAILLIGEGFARFSLPRDIREHLTHGSNQKGPFRPEVTLIS